jgi:hypothetical protein
MQDETTLSQIESPVQPKGVMGWLSAKLPYLVVVILAIVGVALTSMSGTPIPGYWEFLALAIGAACVWIAWRQTPDKTVRKQLIIRQLLHWLAFLIAMGIVLLPSFNTFLNGPATGLALMLLLALGTFTAGIQVSWEIAALGIVLALTVPALAWLKQAALVLVLVVLVIGAFAIAFRPQKNVA